GKVCGGIYDVAFNNDRDGLFCPSVVVTGNPENARKIIYFDSTGNVTKTRELKEWSQVRISENGKYLAIMHPEKYDEEFHYGPVDIIDLSTGGEKIKGIDTPFGTDKWWVSPTGDEIALQNIWEEKAEIYYFRGRYGNREANLTKRKGDVIIFDSKPAVKWAGTENKYLQIGSCITKLSGKLHWSLIATSPNGKYVFFPNLSLYTKNGIVLQQFDLNTKGIVLPTFSYNSKYLVVAVKNRVFFIDVKKKKVLWRYEFDDRDQRLHRYAAIDFHTEEPFYIAGIFQHHRHIVIFSKNGEVIIDKTISKTSNLIREHNFKVNKKGDMICYVTAHKIRVLKVRGIK
ncbi:hypothetical protein KAU34_07070, partial [candidate division WOR-3 bacterium]|nr:hypothetical protein [candidate division WOR-3 bacterium]